MRDRLELGLAIGLATLIALARWREYRWRRTPLGQADLVLSRERERRIGERHALERQIGQRQALARWHAAQVAVLVLVGAALVAWSWRAVR